MPHLHSASARSIRRERAIAKGYVVPRSRGDAFVEVPERLPERARIISKSLKVHDAHNQVSGHGLHFARQAAFAASSGDAELQGALPLRRAANRAKRRWADIDDSTEDLLPAGDPSPSASSLQPAGGACEAAVPPCAHRNRQEDFYTVAGALVVGAVSPPSCGAEGYVWPGHSPNFNYAPLTLPTLAAVDLASVWQKLENLELQMACSAKLDVRLSAVEARVEEVASSISQQLRNYVPTQMFKGLSTDIPLLISSTLDKQLGAVVEKCAPIVTDLAELRKIVDNLRSEVSTGGASSRFEEDMTKKFVELRERVERFEWVAGDKVATEARGKVPEVGDAVLVQGVQNDLYNRRYGTCVGLDPASGRHLVSFWHDLPTVKLRAEHLVVNAPCVRCGACLGGRTYCSSCNYGDIDGRVDRLPRATASTSSTRPSSSDRPAALT